MKRKLIAFLKWQFYIWVLCFTLLVIASFVEEKIYQLRFQKHPLFSNPYRFAVTLKRQTDKKETIWKARETCILVGDMWDNHYCKTAAKRTHTLAKKIDLMLSKTRQYGTHIIFCPSDTMPYYKNHPNRKMMQQFPNAPILKAHILNLINWIRFMNIKKCPTFERNPAPPACNYVFNWTKQTDALSIYPTDGISTNFREIFNYVRYYNIKHIVLVGVHTNVCILGRHFGIKELKRHGLNVVICRDLTDAITSPCLCIPNYKNQGTLLAIKYIETYWCPSILSTDLTTPLQS